MGKRESFRLVAFLSAVAIGSACLAQSNDGPIVEIGPAAGPASQPGDQPGRVDRLPVIRPVNGGPAPITRRPVVTRGPATQPAATRPDTTAKIPMPERAFLRLKLGWYELAEKDLGALLKADETKLPAAVALSELYRRTGRYEESAKVLENVPRPSARSPAPGDARRRNCWPRGASTEEALKLVEPILAEDAAARTAAPGPGTARLADAPSPLAGEGRGGGIAATEPDEKAHAAPDLPVTPLTAGDAVLHARG